jgi:hypothetical protein
MPQDESTADPSGLRIERPLCPNCQTSMALARIMPGIPGFELRYFECRHCGQVVKETVARDAAKQPDDIGWFFERLKPPD